MPYVQRTGGKVCGCFANIQTGYAEEFLLDSHADVTGFLSPVIDFAALKFAEMMRWKSTRDQYAGRLASIAGRLYTSDPAGSASADAVATSLLGLFTDPSVLAATDITAYKLALKARYVQAVLLATPSARAEFGRYDQ